MRNVWLAIVGVVACGSISSTEAQVYPSRPITMVVPFAAGGPTDTIGRIIVEPMRASLSQPVIIENVTGAAGSIGVGRVAHATPDGYTIVIGQWGTHVVNGATYSLQYDLLKDFEPIALIASTPSLIVSKTSVPAADLKQLIAWLKANPTRHRREAVVRAARRTSKAFYSKERPVHAFSTCRIAVLARLCRICWRDKST